jgi:hypothetical protein
MVWGSSPELSSASHKWNINFLIAVHDWEVDLCASFFNLVYSVRVRPGGENKICWVPSKTWLFDVRSYYSILVPYDITHFLLRNIWRNKVPLGVTFFAWSAALGKIHIDTLRK